MEKEIFMPSLDLKEMKSAIVDMRKSFTTDLKEHPEAAPILELPMKIVQILEEKLKNVQKDDQLNDNDKIFVLAHFKLIDYVMELAQDVCDEEDVEDDEEMEEEFKK